MRLGFGVLVSAAFAMSACADDRSAQVAVDWGCGPVDGVAAISRDGAPDWVLVGEATESSETPAAFADLACHLATDGQPVFVGVTQYLGGDTDAETAMLSRLDQMIAKGAPLMVERISGSDMPYALRNRDRGEEMWAATIAARVSARGAKRAVLLVPQADMLAAPVLATNDGIDAQDPKAVFLRGKVVSLEAIATPVEGLTGPTIRSFREGSTGFHGELAFNRVTRPILAIQYADSIIAGAMASDPETFGVKDRELKAAIDRNEPERQAAIWREAEAWVRRLAEGDTTEAPADAHDLPVVSPEVELQEFKAE
jgi:hypothetical protein